MRILVYLFCLFLLPIRGLADSCHAIAINGLTRINASLTLGELIDKAAQGVPEMSLVQAKSDEAAAYRDYADSLFAGSHVAQIGYLDHEPIDGSGQKQFDFSITVQPWQWGENSAVERIANAAGTEHNLYREFVRYSVAGLVRESLWRIALASFEREKVMQQLGLVSDLLDVVTTRVRSGDLAETDLLLARSEFLASKAELIRANGKLGMLFTPTSRLPGWTKFRVNSKKSGIRSSLSTRAISRFGY
jgi:outer membrane protein TolC